MKQEVTEIVQALSTFAKSSMKDGNVNKIIDYTALYDVIDNLLSVQYILEQESL